MYNYCGKNWSKAAIRRIRKLIAASPEATRAELSRKVCRAFAWHRTNGQLADMSCRVAMLRMHRDGLIALPPPRDTRRPTKGIFASAASDPQPLLEATVNHLEDLRLELVAPGKDLTLWNEFISRYHYLGYKATPGAQLRYFIKAGERLLGAMGFGSAAWKVAPRDDFIGWAADGRRARLHLIVNQTRFLILPWIRCQNLATKSIVPIVRWI